MATVFYLIYDTATGEGRGSGWCDGAMLEHQQFEAGCKPIIIASSVWHQVQANPHLYYVDGAIICLKKKVNVTLSKPSLIADGKDILTISTDAGQPVRLWVNGFLEGTHETVQVFSCVPRSYEVRVDDPRFYSDPVFFVARQEVTPEVPQSKV